MAEIETREFTPAQKAVLERLLKAGFRFVTFERYARYLAVEKEGFVALLALEEGGFEVFGQVGYRIGEGIGMLVERRERKAFVWKEELVPASQELLDAYARFKSALEALLSVIA